MSEKEKNTLAGTLAAVDQALNVEDEQTIMAIAQAYAAGKEAGKREAMKAAQSEE